MKAPCNLYFTKDKQTLVPASDPGHRFWAYAEGETVAEKDESKVGVKMGKKPADKSLSIPETK